MWFQLTYGRAWQGQGARGVASQQVPRPGSAAALHSSLFSLQDHISPSEDLPFLPPRVLMRAKETESDNVRAPCGLCWSWVSGKPSGVTISLRLEKPTHLEELQLPSQAHLMTTHYGIMAGSDPKRHEGVA